MGGVEAQIRISRPGIAHMSMVVLVLACLLSGFFWLGYWTSELTSRVADPREVQSEPADPHRRTNPAPTPTQQLDIRSGDVVRL